MNTSATPIIVDPPRAPKPPLWRRLLRKLLLLGFASFLLLVLSSVVIAAFFEEQIGQRLLTEINKQLKTELRVASFELSLLSGFPKVSANLQEVVLDDAMKGTLLEAENVSFRFGLLSLLSSDVKVHSVLIEDGALFVRIDRKGRMNYDILKEKESTTTSAENSDLAISLEEARLQDIELIYIDDRAKQQVRLQVEDATASGQFSREAFSMTSVATMQSDFVEMKDGRFLVGKRLAYDTRMKVDLANRKYEFEDMSLAVSSNVFLLNGKVESAGSATDFDLELTAQKGSIESVVDLLPEQYLGYFSDFTSKGDFDFNATIKGKLTENYYPAIEVKFGLDNGQISGPRLNSALKDVSFEGLFSNGNKRQNQTSLFSVTDFTAHLHRQLIEGKFRLYNLDDPAIDLHLSGVLPLDDIYGLFNVPTISGADGEVEVNDLKLKGRIKDMINQSRISRVKASGSLEFDDASLDFNGREVIVDKGEVKLIDNSLVVEKVKIEAPNTEIHLDGKFANIIPVLLADSQNTGRAELKFHADLYAPKIDLDELLALAHQPLPKGQLRKSVVVEHKAEEIRQRERFTKLLKGTFKARIDEFNYNKIEAERFKGDLEFDNNELLVKGVVDAMDGAFKLDGKMFFKEKPYLKANVEMAGIDVKEFFRQAENFGQQVVQSKHLQGDLQSQLLINAYWDEDGKFMRDRLQVMGDVNITNGELVGFDMLYYFSDYIKIQDLKHIKFQHLQNWLEVRNGRVYIPVMFVQTNAMNLTVSGEHGFDNRIDYNMKINAGQVLINKLKRYNRDMKPQKAARNGWLNLYYRIYGTVDKYKVVQDKRTIKRRFANSEHHKREIRVALLREFNKVEDFKEPAAWSDDQSADSDDTEEYLDLDDTPVRPRENPQETPTEEEGEEEYLDFEIEEGGGGNQEEDEYLWEEDS